MAKNKSRNAQAKVIPTIEDIEKALDGVISKDPSKVTKTERGAISVLIDKYISQNNGNNDCLFSKVTVADNKYTLNEVLSRQHIDAPNTLGKLDKLQAKKVGLTLHDGRGFNTAELAFDLIQNGANPNKQYLGIKNGATLMHVLAYYGASEQFEKAANEYGGNPNVVDNNGDTPAHYLLSNTKLMNNVEYLKPQSHGSVLIAHPHDLGVTKVAKTLNAMRCSGTEGTDFSLKNNAGQTASEVFDDILKAGIAKCGDAKGEVTDEVVSKVISDPKNVYKWSGCRIIRAAIHDVTVGNKDTPVLYEGYETRGGRPMRVEELPPSNETGVLKKLLGDLLGSVELRDASPDKLQAMTQRGAVEKGTMQIT